MKDSVLSVAILRLKVAYVTRSCAVPGVSTCDANQSHCWESVKLRYGRGVLLKGLPWNSVWMYAIACKQGSGIMLTSRKPSTGAGFKLACDMCYRVQASVCKAGGLGSALCMFHVEVATTYGNRLHSEASCCMRSNGVDGTYYHGASACSPCCGCLCSMLSGCSTEAAHGCCYQA